MPNTKPLTTAHQLVLAAAAGRPSGLLLPLPPAAGFRGAVRQRLLTSLLKLGHAEELPTDDAGLCWRKDDQGQGYTLRLAGTGDGGNPDADAAIEADGGQHSTIGEARAEVATPQIQHSGAAAPGCIALPGGKLGQVLAAVSGPAGSTLAELTALTGWLPHTTRAAITRLRQRGHDLSLTERDGRKAYRSGGGG